MAPEKFPIGTTHLTAIHGVQLCLRHVTEPLDQWFLRVGSKWVETGDVFQATKITVSVDMEAIEAKDIHNNVNKH